MTKFEKTVFRYSLKLHIQSSLRSKRRMVYPLDQFQINNDYIVKYSKSAITLSKNKNNFFQINHF